MISIELDRSQAEQLFNLLQGGRAAKLPVGKAVCHELELAIQADDEEQLETELAEVEASAKDKKQARKDAAAARAELLKGKKSAL